MNRRFYWGASIIDSDIHLRQLGEDPAFVCSDREDIFGYGIGESFPLNNPREPPSTNPVCPKCSEWLSEHSFKFLCEKVMKG